MRLDEARTLNPGLLRDQITWQRKVLASPYQNSYGEDVYQWSDLLTCRAQVKALSGRELETAQQRWAEAQYVIRQHYYAGLKRSDRIAWYVDGETRHLDVLDVADRDGIGAAQTVIAKEWAA